MAQGVLKARTTNLTSECGAHPEKTAPEMNYFIKTHNGRNGRTSIPHGAYRVDLMCAYFQTRTYDEEALAVDTRPRHLEISLCALPKHHKS